MDKVKSGDMTCQLEETGDKEFVTLIRGYNSMAEFIRRETGEHQNGLNRIMHLNKVLHAIRKVNQLITVEKNRSSLLKGICDHLVESRGFYNAWVALFDTSRKLIFATEAGLIESFAPMIEQLQNGEPPLCCKKTLKARGAVIIDDPYTTCTHCPLAQYYKTRAAMSIRLEYSGTVYGLLTVSILRELSTDSEERQLFEEVAGDISLALHTLDEEEKRARAESVLKDERNRSQIYLNIAGVIFLALNRKGTIVMINKKGCAVLGYSNKELIGKKWFDTCIPERIRNEIKEVFHKILDGNSEPVEHFENVVLTKSGEERIIHWHNSIVKNGSGEPAGILSSGEDITEKKKTEEALKSSEAQLLQAQKMEAIGRLAGGVAHDFNNLLTVILGYSNMLLLEPKLNKVHLEYITEIKDAGDRASSLTQQLLAFSRKQLLQPEILDLNKIIKGLEKMLRRLLSEDITLTIKSGSHLRAIKADPHQVSQVIMNLVVNANDAVSYGGAITIETKQADLDESICRQHANVKPGTYCMLSIRDNGQGMNEETKRHIFEPFFTTKKAGKGTGLGLSTVYGIVKQSGGFIEITSEEQKGTTFEIFFPALDRAGIRRKSPLKEAETHLGNETILVVEDDEKLCLMITKSLGKFGYKVLQAENGEEALWICESHNGQQIQLLITDVVMPGMHGLSLADTLKMNYPDISILFISGYMENELWQNRILKEGLSFLQKPFTPETLAKKVRNLLKN